MALVPFDDRDGLIWMDGAMVQWRDAKIHILTHGLHYASGVFEGERCYSGNIFKLHEHTERLIASGRILGFEIPWTADQIDEACRQVITANGHTDAYVRPIAWRGSEGLSVSAQMTKIHLGHRLLGLAEPVRRRSAAGCPPRHGAVEAARIRRRRPRPPRRRDST